MAVWPRPIEARKPAATGWCGLGPTGYLVVALAWPTRDEVC